MLERHRPSGVDFGAVSFCSTFVTSSIHFFTCHVVLSLSTVTAVESRSRAMSCDMPDAGMQSGTPDGDLRCETPDKLAAAAIPGSGEL